MKKFLKRFLKLKRFKSGIWIAIAGVVGTALTILLESIDRFELGELPKMIAVIILTALISQITKAINTSKK